MSVKVEQLDSQLGEAKKKARKEGYVQQLKSELGKVAWTGKEEVFSSTKVVVVSTFLFGIGSYLADILIKSVLNGLGGMIRLIFG